MKAIIPIAGAGKRLRPFTYTQPKPLIPVAGKPILGYIIEGLLKRGVSEFVFVIGYLGDKVREYVEEVYPKLQAQFVWQNERRGSGHAVYLAQEAVGEDEPVVIVFGDTLIEGSVEHIIHCPHSCMAIKPVEDPRKFGIVELDEDGKVMGLSEKPKMPRSNQAMVGFYKISNYGQLHKALGQVLAEAVNPHQEFTLTDGLINLLDRGHEMHATRVDRWYDCGNLEILLATNRELLEKQGYAESQTPAFDRTILIHPVTIGKNCRISDAIIGPHVSVGDYATIERSIVSDSILGRYAQLHDVSLTHSVVGNDTQLNGKPRSINIGDNTELDIG